MAISPIFQYLLQAGCNFFFKFFRLNKKNYGNAYTELPPDGALKYAEKAFYDVLVAPVGITSLSG
jgi:hypothetical protein